jgi:hypothetical protein
VDLYSTSPYVFMASCLINLSDTGHSSTYDSRTLTARSSRCFRVQVLRDRDNLIYFIRSLFNDVLLTLEVSYRRVG